MSELEKIDVEQVTVYLGGKDRRLVFGMKAAKVLQKKHGTLGEAFGVLAKMSETGLDVEGLESILFALLSIDKSITQEVVTDWIEEIEDLAEARKLVDGISRAIKAGSPVASEDPPTPAKS